MKRVCHMTSAHPPGDIRIFRKECVSLARAGYEVFLVQRGESGEDSGVRLVGVGEPSGGRLTRMTSFAGRIYQAALALDADLYHIHDPELLPYGLRLKKQGKRVLFDSHESTAEAILEKTWLPGPLRRGAHLWYSRYEVSVCRRLDAVISVSPHIVDYFSRINPRTVQVANYPVLRRDVPQPDLSQPRAIFAGNVTPQWMHETVLQALGSVPAYRYTLCGPCSPGYLARLGELPGWDRTDYLGRIPQDEVFARMARSSVGLALLRPGRNTDGRRGTMGNTKLFEEMMAGLPVICTDFALWRELVEHWQCGICVDPEDPEALAAALRRLAEHPEEARRMGENGRRAVEEAFNWEGEERKLLALYEDILKE